MTTLAVDFAMACAVDVLITEDTLTVELSDGRTIAVPLEWFPRLVEASSEERNDWCLVGQGQGIHWNALDEDISVEAIVAGRPSQESQASFSRWLVDRQVD